MPRLPKGREITLWGLTLPITNWTVSGISALVLVGVGGVIYKQVIETPPSMLSMTEMNARLATEVEEYGLHAMEEPTKHEYLEDADGGLALRIYPDHCVMIQRKTRRGIRTKLIVDLARENVHASNQVVKPNDGLLPVASAAQNCAGGCLNPHPGQFRWWYGVRNGDWVEVWRQWPEGCRHVQLFHPSSGSWDTNPNGTPRVRWMCCVH